MKKLMLLLLCCTVCFTGCGDKSTTGDNAKETDKSVVESKPDSGAEDTINNVQVAPLRDVNEEYATENLNSIKHVADSYFLVDVENGSSFLVDSEGKFLLETYENCSINNGYLVTYEGLDKIAVYSIPDLKKIELEDDVIECLNVENKFAVLKNDIFTTYSASWDLKTGKLLWKNLENAFPSPAYVMNSDYNIAEYRDSVYSLETGKIFTDGYTDIRDTAILNNGLVVIWQNNDLVSVLDTTGTVVSEFTMTDDLYDTVCGMRFDDRLYFYDGGAAVFEFSSMMVDINGTIIADNLHRDFHVNERINDYYISSIDAYELDDCVYLGKDGILSDIPAKEGYNVLSEDITKWERKDSGDTKFIIENKRNGKSLETFVYKANIDKNNTNNYLYLGSRIFEDPVKMYDADTFDVLFEFTENASLGYFLGDYYTVEYKNDDNKITKVELRDKSGVVNTLDIEDGRVITQSNNVYVYRDKDCKNMYFKDILDITE